MDSAGKTVVLVVDDEPFVCETTADFLLEEGFQTLRAADAAQALALLADHPEIDVLFTDVDMPGGMNGWGLAVRVMMTWPGMHIVVASGKTAPEAGRMPLPVTFIEKPYAVRDVASMMISMVAAGR